jgi:DNA-binding CsgD family transcriptional regulator
MSQIVLFSSGVVMSDVILDDTFVMLCDWRGSCIWKSAATVPVNVGGFIWEQLTIESQKATKLAVGQVVAVRETQQLEVIDQQGERYRGWLWPLDSPEVAVCVLALRIPRNLALLTGRERQCLELLGQGIETRLIAKQLDVSLSTVHTHMKRARERLGLRSVEALISFAARYFYPTKQALSAPPP